MNLPHTLDDEFKRVAKAEGIFIEELVAEVSRLIQKSERQIYNYRSGKWELPGSLIPILCRRFRSRALLIALEEECQDTTIEIPEGFELTLLVSQTVRADLQHYESFLKAFEDGAIDARELAELRESSDRVVLNVRHFEAIAVTDYERRASARGAQSSGTPAEQSNGTLKIQRN
jgi:hypothetical protein